MVFFFVLSLYGFSIRVIFFLQNGLDSIFWKILCRTDVHSLNISWNSSVLAGLF